MFQKGTGERFKYKEAVQEKYPNAICVRLTYAHGTRYHVKDSGGGGKTLSKESKTAENAWADVWVREIKGK